MIAKRNAEVAELNALARRAMKAAGPPRRRGDRGRRRPLRCRRSGHHPDQRPAPEHLQPRAMASGGGRCGFEAFVVGRNRHPRAGVCRFRLLGALAGEGRRPGDRTRLRRDHLPGPGSDGGHAPSSWPTPRWIGRSSTSPRLAAGSRPSSTPRPRSSSTATSTRRARRTCAKGSTTSPKPPSATTPRSRPTTRPCARSSASFPPTSSPTASMSFAPRLEPSSTTKAGIPRRGGDQQGHRAA